MTTSKGRSESAKRALSFCQMALELHHSDAREVGKGYLSVYHGHTFEAVVGNEEVAVEVGEVDEWRECCCCVYRSPCLASTSYHHAYAACVGVVQHLTCLAHAGTLHQFDVDAREGALNGFNVL